MLVDKTPGRARRVAGAGFIAIALLGAGLAAWAQKPVLPVFAGATVEVSRDGRVLWNGKPVDGAEPLSEQARNQVASGIPHLRLSVDPSTPYNNVGRVIEAAQKRGMEDIMLLPSGTVLKTPKPPGPGSNVPAPPVPTLAIIQPPAAATPSTTPVAGAAQGFPDPLRVFVDFDDSVFLNGKVVDMPTLERVLRENAALNMPPEVHIEPHKQARYERVEHVIAAANKAGLVKIGVIGGT